jgi:hypothetical protein
MRKVTLTREEAGDSGTFGTLLTDHGYQCKTLELPSRNNEVGKSCIPAGTYTVTWRTSPHHGACYHVEDVPGRTAILIHAANFPHELLGCIAPGKSYWMTNGKKAGVQSSRNALDGLEQDLKRSGFQLTIVEAYK